MSLTLIGLIGKKRKRGIKKEDKLTYWWRWSIAFYNGWRNLRKKIPCCRRIEIEIRGRSRKENKEEVLGEKIENVIKIKKKEKKKWCEQISYSIYTRKDGSIFFFFANSRHFFRRDFLQFLDLIPSLNFIYFQFMHALNFVNYWEIFWCQI